MDEGAGLVDICEADGHARERIAEAPHLPLSKLREASIAVGEGKPMIFCAAAALVRSPMRSVRAVDAGRSITAAAPSSRRSVCRRSAIPT